MTRQKGRPTINADRDSKGRIKYPPPLRVMLSKDAEEAAQLAYAFEQRLGRDGLLKLLKSEGESEMSDDMKIKAEAVMEFVDYMVGAFDAGLIDESTLTIADIYQMARNHVADNYSVSTKSLSEEWGSYVFSGCGGEG